jgi:hypothetical protein
VRLPSKHARLLLSHILYSGAGYGRLAQAPCVHHTHPPVFSSTTSARVFAWSKAHAALPSQSEASARCRCGTTTTADAALRTLGRAAVTAPTGTVCSYGDCPWLLYARRRGGHGGCGGCANNLQLDRELPCA